MSSKLETFKRALDLFAGIHHLEADPHQEFRGVESAIDSVLAQNRIGAGPIPEAMHSGRFDFGHRNQTYFFEEQGIGEYFRYKIRLSSAYSLNEKQEKIHGAFDLSIIDCQTGRPVQLINGDRQNIMARKGKLIDHAKTVVQRFVKTNV